MKFNDIINSDKPTLVDFFAVWCGPCQTMSPILTDLKRDMGEDVNIIKIDIDKNQELASKLRIKSVPTLLLYKNGESKWRESGVFGKEQLKALIKQYV